MMHYNSQYGGASGVKPIMGSYSFVWGRKSGYDHHSLSWAM